MKKKKKKEKHSKRVKKEKKKKSKKQKREEKSESTDSSSVSKRRAGPCTCAVQRTGRNHVMIGSVYKTSMWSSWNGDCWF